MSLKNEDEKLGELLGRVGAFLIQLRERKRAEREANKQDTHISSAVEGTPQTASTESGAGGLKNRAA